MAVYKVAVGSHSSDVFVVEADSNMDAVTKLRDALAGGVDPDCMVTIEHITDNSVIRAENQ